MAPSRILPLPGFFLPDRRAFGRILATNLLVVLAVLSGAAILTSSVL